MANNLAEALKKVLANTFAFRIKAQNYHWNCEGKDFYSYHKYLGELYEEVDSAVDEIAEHIRTLDVYVPGSFTRFQELSDIEDELLIPTSHDMIVNLQKDNEIVLKSLKFAHHLAEDIGAFGIINFIEERIDVHDKHNWQLKSLAKRDDK